MTVSVVGSTPPRGNERFIYINIFISSLWLRGKSAALTSATQHAIPPESSERSILAVGSAYPTVCGIQLEADLFFYDT